MYGAIWTEQPAHIINLASKPKVTKTKLTLETCPVGCDPHPRTESSLKAAARDICNGLRWLHSKGFVHRDLRWGNIIAEEGGSMRIIDLEYSGKAGDVPPTTLLQWPPLPGGQYTTKADMLCLCSMLSQFAGLGGELLKDFLGQLAAGISAEDSLKHPWLDVAGSG